MTNKQTDQMNSSIPNRLHCYLKHFVDFYQQPWPNILPEVTVTVTRAMLDTALGQALSARTGLAYVSRIGRHLHGRRVACDHLVGLVVKAPASRAEEPGFESRLRRDFSGVESLQNWHSSGYPARRLVLYGQCWDWLAQCQYTVTG